MFGHLAGQIVVTHQHEKLSNLDSVCPHVNHRISDVMMIYPDFDKYMYIYIYIIVIVIITITI